MPSANIGLGSSGLDGFGCAKTVRMFGMFRTIAKHTRFPNLSARFAAQKMKEQFGTALRLNEDMFWKLWSKSEP